MIQQNVIFTSIGILFGTVFTLFGSNPLEIVIRPREKGICLDPIISSPSINIPKIPESITQSLSPETEQLEHISKPLSPEAEQPEHISKPLSPEAEQPEHISKPLSPEPLLPQPPPSQPILSPLEIDKILERCKKQLSQDAQDYWFTWSFSSHVIQTCGSDLKNNLPDEKARRDVLQKFLDNDITNELEAVSTRTRMIGIPVLISVVFILYIGWKSLDDNGTPKPN